MANHITDPSGVTKVTMSKHWLEGDTRVNETSAIEGCYNVYFQKKGTPAK